MLDSAFLQGCEATAAAWDVPALAVGASVGGATETAAIGCEVETIFRIASLTKPFTALLALELLDLESQTGIWAADVRVRHLLSHTSGYDGECGDLARFGSGDDALPAAVAELERVRRWVGVEGCWSYANTGYCLAGWLAANAAASTYEDAVATRLLDPLGLEATSFGEPELAPSGPDAKDEGYPRARRPSGGLVSNVADLLRFGRRLLDAPQLRVVQGKPVGGVYGLGLSGERVGRVEVWGHRGSYGGFESSLLTVPDRDAIFVGLTSSSFGSKALWEIENLFFERVVGARRRTPETFPLPADARAAFAGTYANSDSRYELALDGDGVVVTFDDGEHAARPIGVQTFEILDGEHVRERFDFPLEGFGRFGSRLAERVA
ncbi:MAG: serine hydrolase domain-containing protein [Gaiellaceae bacterium]